MSPPPSTSVIAGSSAGMGENDSPFIRPQAPTPKRGSLRCTEGILQLSAPPAEPMPAPASEKKKSGVLKSSRESSLAVSLTVAYPRSRIQTVQFPTTKQQHLPTPLDRMDMFASSPPSSWREPPFRLEPADGEDCGAREGERGSTPQKDTRDMGRPRLQQFPPYNPSPDTSPETRGSSSDMTVETPTAPGSSEGRADSSGTPQVNSTPSKPPRPQRRKGKAPPLAGMRPAPPPPLSASVAPENLSMLFSPSTSSTPPSQVAASDSEAEESRPTTPTPTRPKTPLIYTPPRTSSLPARYHQQNALGRLAPLTPITPEKPVTPSKLRKKPGQVTKLRSKNRLRAEAPSSSLPPASPDRSPTPKVPPSRAISSTLPGRTTPFPPLEALTPPGTVGAATAKTEGISVTSVTVQRSRHAEEEESARRATTPSRNRKRFSLFDEEWFRRSPAAETGSTVTPGTVTAGAAESVRSGYNTLGHSTVGRSTVGHSTGHDTVTKHSDQGENGLKEPTWVSRLFRRPSSPRPRSPSITSISSPTRIPPSPLRQEPESPSKFKTSFSKARGLRLSPLRSKAPDSGPSTQPHPSTPKPNQPKSPSRSERWLKKSRSKASLRSLLHLRSSSESSEAEGWCTECGERCTRHSPHTQDPFANLSAPTSFPNTPLLPSNAAAVLARGAPSLLESAPWGAQRQRSHSATQAQRGSGDSDGWQLIGLSAVAGQVGSGGQFGSVRQRTRSNASTHSYPPYPTHSHSLSYPPDQTRRRSISLNTIPNLARYKTAGARAVGTIPEHSEPEAEESASGAAEYTFPPPPPRPVGGFPPLPPLPPLPSWAVQSSSSGSGTYASCRSRANANSGHRSSNSHDSQHSHYSQHSQHSQQSQQSQRSQQSQQSQYSAASAQSAHSAYSKYSSGSYSRPRANSASSARTNGRPRKLSAWTIESDPVPQPEPQPEISRWSDSD